MELDVSHGSAIFEHRGAAHSVIDPSSKTSLKAERPIFRSKINIERKIFEDAPSKSAIF